MSAFSSPSSKFLLSNTFLLRCSNTHKLKQNIFHFPSFLFSKSPFSTSLKFIRHCSSSTATIDVSNNDNGLETIYSHPWPEWVSFVDRLKTKGYFNNANELNESVYNDINQLKDPSLSFSRDRYDLFKLLTPSDVETVVKYGCPNILRKTVNSGKRLRAFACLDEGDVCSNCSLRGSCDRAYVILKDDEADARTVDLVRLLLSYALDPLVISEHKPPGREVVEASVRKLLSDLINLSQTTPDPPVKKPAVKAVDQKKQEKRYSNDKKPAPSDAVKGEKLTQDVEMKRGDWLCPKCNFLNFSRNIRCRECNDEVPKKVDASGVEMKKGDWMCPSCDFMNFSRNVRCRKCKKEGPERVPEQDVERRKGDWDCLQCGFMNYARNKKCLRCREDRPKRNLNPGEWECPSCDFVNFRKNTVCLMCKRDRPKEETTEYEEHIWQSPR